MASMVIGESGNVVSAELYVLLFVFFFVSSHVNDGRERNQFCEKSAVTSRIFKRYSFCNSTETGKRIEIKKTEINRTGN